LLKRTEFVSVLKINKLNIVKSTHYRRYETALKNTAIELISSGKSISDIARLLSINVQSLYQWKQELKRHKIDSIISSVDQSDMINQPEPIHSQADNRIETLTALIEKAAGERDRIKQVIIVLLEALD
jgi:transposase-like protein